MFFDSYTNALLVIAIGGVIFFIFSNLKSNKPFLNGTRQILKLSKKIWISKDTVQLSFKLPSQEMSLGLPIGQHIRIYCAPPKGEVRGEWNGKPDSDTSEIARKYTPVDSSIKGSLELVVKVYKPKKPQFCDGGKMSQNLGSLNIGDSITLEGPLGGVAYESPGIFTNRGKLLVVEQLGMIAGGTGITPMLQVANHILAEVTDTVQIVLLFANKTEDDILLKSIIDGLVKQYPKRFKVFYTLDDPPKNWDGFTGFITKDMIKKTMPSPGSETAIALCGPPPMVHKLFKKIKKYIF
eukprot:GHVL01044321.1.p1 GENE.GHVL01044321.1~~GHVL01044321.1.p1  ORF type:complete len:295 (+),score=51.22 GHVL01044321.1:86-970(+)